MSSSPDAPGIVRLQSVPNLRDFGGMETSSGQRVKQGLLFRSSALSNATDEDFKWILEHVRTVVDLRDAPERKKDAKNPLSLSHKALVENYVVSTFHGKWKYGHAKNSPPAADARQLFSIPLMPMKQTKKVVWHGTNMKQKTNYVFNCLFRCDQRTAVKGMMPAVWSLGLKGLNQLILEHSQKSLFEVLKIIASEPQPVVFHCTIGKDRTGLISGLVLSVLGVPRAEIVQNYALTDKLIPDDFLAPQREDGLNEEMLASPPQVMEETLAWIDGKYGSIDAYLDEIGFNKEWRERLRSVYLE